MPKYPWQPIGSNEFYPQTARAAAVRVLYDGAEYDVTEKLVSLQYTDNASGALDDLSLTLECRDGHAFQPEKEKDLDVTILLPNWYENGQGESYHCGNFVVDDITLTGNPKTMTVKAISEPASTAFKEVPVTNTWQQVGLRAVAEVIMQKHGMSELVFNAVDVLVAKMEQSQKSDSEFLQEACKKYGLALKVYKKGLVIFDEGMMEGRDSYSYFGNWPENWTALSEDWTPHEIDPGWTWNSTLQGTYTGAEVSYTETKKEQAVKVSVGTAERVLYVTEKAGDPAEAEKIAREKVNEANKKAVTLSFRPTLFDPKLFASYCVDIVNMDARINGKYYVEKVSTSYSSAGLFMDVEARKVFPRL